MVELELSLVYVFTGLFSYVLSSSAANTLETQSNQNDVIHHLDTVGSQLQTLSRSIRSAHTEISRRQLEECHILGAMSDTVCDLLLMDKELGEAEGINQAIHSQFSPGKRAGDSFSDISQRKLLLADLLQKQTFLENLRDMVDEAQASVQNERKRSCNLNLGFHCQTEQYSAIADMYNWLQSSLSPGRRRRRAIKAIQQEHLNPQK